MHSRRHFLRMMSAGALAAATPSLARGAEEKWNFVLILADDMGWADAGCYGSRFYETPNLDRLAAEGMRFTDGYAACPVCSPTRASIMTGKYPARLDLTNWLSGRIRKKLIGAPYIQQLPLEEVTLAEALKEAGYATCHVGKWHLGGKPYYPEHQGFDVNIAGNHTGTPAGGYFSPHRNPQLPDGPKGEHLTDRLSHEAVRFIEKSKDRPFFLYLAHYAVHTPIQGKKDLSERYRAKAGKLPPHQGPRTIPEGTTAARQVQDHPVYAAMVHTLDESVGRVMAKLRELGIEDRTVVCFMSDNGGLSTRGGPTSNLPLRAGKGWLYEGGVREPFLIKWPGMTKPGSTCSVPVTSTDFYPTMLDIAGLPPRPAQHADGVSLVPVLRGAKSLGRQAIYWHYPHYSPQGGTPGAAVRAGDLKLIEFFEDRHVELYDLGKDIGEKRDLAADMPEKAAELRKMLHDWLEAVDAKMPRPNPAYKEKAASPTPAKPQKKGTKDGDFQVLRGAAADASPLGYAVRSSGGTGIALKRLDTPIAKHATFTLKLQSLPEGDSPRTYRNGFLLLGNESSQVSCGLYLGGRRFCTIQDSGGKSELPFPGDPKALIDLRVTLDVAGRKVIMEAGGVTVTRVLRGPVGPITHVGYATTNTATAFSPVAISSE